MSFADRAKDLLGDAKEQAEKIAVDHGEQVEGAIDKAADLIASKTPGGADDKVRAAAEKAKEMVEKLAEDAEKPAAGA